MTAPFTDATRAEVVLRVAYQLVVCEYRRCRGDGTQAGTLIARAQCNELVKKSLDFRLALSSMYQHCITNKRASREWHDECLRRARMGMLFRAVFAWDYKDGRRDPRVTNRGVSQRARGNSTTPRVQALLDRSTPDE